VGDQRILVVEDDETISNEVCDALVSHGYAVSAAPTGRKGLELARSLRPDLVVLDLGLPDLDGVQLCRTLRAETAAVPIVIVTARDADIDIVVGLDAGATDYVTKPFTMAVLLARIRAHLRQDSAAPVAVVQVGELTVDLAAHRAHLSGEEVDLRPKEFALLAALVADAGKVVSRDRLLRDVWDVHWETATKTLEIHIHALRRKLGERVGGGPWITTVRSVGYRFELP
jgi:DNA-binding response OmpR family regulator